MQLPLARAGWRCSSTRSREARRLGLGVDMATGTGWPFGGRWVGDREPRVHGRWSPTQPGRSAAGERLDASRCASVPDAAGRARIVGAASRSTDLKRTARREPRPAAPRTRPGPLREGRCRWWRSRPRSSTGADRRPDARVAADGAARLDRARRATGRSTRSSRAGTARWSSAPLPAARATSSTTSPAGPARLPAQLRRRPSPATTSAACAPSSTTPTRSTTPRARPTGRRRSSRSSSSRRGYDLRHHLPALFGKDDADRRPACSPTIARPSPTCCSSASPGPGSSGRRARGAIVRNQAHGSPANMLDLYAASGHSRDRGPRPAADALAVSAAHVAGRPLASAEAATWLGEHFRSTLADVRKAVDDYLPGGVNHIVYHGTTFSPPEAPWPGWPFYAAVHFEPTEPVLDGFRDAQPVRHADAVLPAGRASPRATCCCTTRSTTRWPPAGRAARPLRRRPAQQDASPFLATARALDARGHAYDFVSDRQLEALRTVARRAADRGRLVQDDPGPGVPLHPPADLRGAARARARGGDRRLRGRAPRATSRASTTWRRGAPAASAHRRG